METKEIILKKIDSVNDSELQELIEMMDSSFASAMKDYPGNFDEIPIPEGKQLISAIEAGVEVLKIYLSGELAGGCVLLMNEEKDEISVDHLFIAPDKTGKGAGTKVWKEIEKTYPDTKKWSLGTPLFLKRNIHFYINKCGFVITKYYNQWNPYMMGDEAITEDFLWFEKEM